MQTALTTEPQSPEGANADVSAAVEDLLNTLSNKFASVSSEIFAKSRHRHVRLPLQEVLANSGATATSGRNVAQIGQP